MEIHRCRLILRDNSAEGLSPNNTEIVEDAWDDMEDRLVEMIKKDLINQIGLELVGKLEIIKWSE